MKREHVVATLHQIVDSVGALPDELPSMITQSVMCDDGTVITIAVAETDEDVFYRRVAEVDRLAGMMITVERSEQHGPSTEEGGW